MRHTVLNKLLELLGVGFLTSRFGDCLLELERPGHLVLGKQVYLEVELGTAVGHVRLPVLAHQDKR
jgi:hypothetical protein